MKHLPRRIAVTIVLALAALLSAAPGFAALSPAYAGAWFGVMVERLLENDRDTLKLLRRSPFPPDAPPRYVRARLFRYRYTSWRELRATGACWERTYVREFLPPTRLAVAVQRP